MQAHDGASHKLLQGWVCTSSVCQVSTSRAGPFCTPSFTMKQLGILSLSVFGELRLGSDSIVCMVRSSDLMTKDGGGHQETLNYETWQMARR